MDINTRNYRDQVHLLQSRLNGLLIFLASVFDRYERIYCKIENCCYDCGSYGHREISQYPAGLLPAPYKCTQKQMTGSRARNS